MDSEDGVGASRSERSDATPLPANCRAILAPQPVAWYTFQGVRSQIVSVLALNHLAAST